MAQATLSVSSSSLPVGYTIALQPPPGPSVFSTFDPSSSPATACSSPHHTFNDAMQVRLAVFCDEQGCSAANELDDDDPRSWHWVLYDHNHHHHHHDFPFNPATSSTSTVSSSSSSPEAVAMAVLRLVPPPHAPHPNGYVDAHEEPYVKLGRFATAKPYRGRGFGRAVVDAAVEWARSHASACEEQSSIAAAAASTSSWKGMVLVHAQVSVERMWAKMGFQTDDKLGRWDEEGIEHLGMWRRLDIR